MPSERHTQFERRFVQVVNGYLDGEYGELAERFRTLLGEAKEQTGCGDFEAIHLAVRHLRMEDPTLYGLWLEVNRKTWAATTHLEGGSPFYFA
jgi:hypothetical protein